MENREFIPINELCQVYEIDIVFFDSLLEYDLIEIVIEEETPLLPASAISKLERILRIHRDLHVNIEGVDVILNLLNKLDQLESELDNVKNRLGLYENE
jgi:hypothetical protein